jgi:hypothetical protein
MKLLRVTQAAVLLVAALCPLSAATTTPNAIALAGSGYHPANAAMEAAPGQLVIVSVYGIQTQLPEATLMPPGNSGWPNGVGGVTVDLVQGDAASTTGTPVEVQAVQQSQCGQSDLCSTVTSFTLQIPNSLAFPGPTYSYQPRLRISEKGAPVGFVLLAPVTDAIHVLNSCDGTEIFLSAAYGTSPNSCVPMVLNSRELISLGSPAHSGDELAVWAYGLGTVTPSDSKGGIYQRAPVTGLFLLNFDYSVNASASPAVAGFGVTASPLSAVYTGGGGYQVNFIVPPVPAGLPLCDGVRVKSNLTVTITGSHSFDAAKICVVP